MVTMKGIEEACCGEELGPGHRWRVDQPLLTEARKTVAEAGGRQCEQNLEDEAELLTVELFYC